MYIDSGAMYRAAALEALRRGVPMGDHDELGRVALVAVIELTDRGRGPVLLNGDDVTTEIRAPEVTDAASVMSTVPAVRRALVRQQREIGRSTDCVMEGRDIGTVVFPDADLKIFLTASLEERARRRHAEFSMSAGQADIGQVIREIEERDRRDSTRSDSPLRKAKDAVELDTTGLTIEQQVGEIVRIARDRDACGSDRGTGAKEE